MKKINILSLILLCIIPAALIAQVTGSPGTTASEKNIPDKKEMRGRVLDMKKNTPLPYANVYVLHKNKGVISNENGYFALDIAGLAPDDTVCFQYMGYQTKKIPLGRADTASLVFMKEDIINLSETLIFGTAPDADWIVRQVLVHKDSNYSKTTDIEQTFIRQRDIGDFEDFQLNYKKSDIEGIDKELLDTLENKVPKHTTSFSDFLGNLYFTSNPDDSVKLKIDPIRMVVLKEKEMDDLKQYDSLFENLLTVSGKNEYWKVRSGIFGEKIDDMKEDTVSAPDTVTRKDTVPKNRWNVKSYGGSIRYMRRYSTLDDKGQWEFLYNTGRYRYTLAGGTSVNGEDVYIIDFTPKNSGLYTGRLFISTTTYALIRADYEYAPGKIGRSIQLLGIGYSETGFSGSIYFEKHDDNYLLKYFSNRENVRFSFDRGIVLVKKKKRWLFDKKLNEFKMNLVVTARMESSTEYLALDDRPISEEQFLDYRQPKDMEIIYVDQFNDKLWQGYSIIEPTERMKEYRKGGQQSIKN